MNGASCIIVLLFFFKVRKEVRICWSFSMCQKLMLIAEKPKLKKI